MNIKNLFATNQQTATESKKLIEEAGLVREKMMGCKTGLVELDNTLRGLTQGKLYVAGGRPGAGKTSFATTLTSNLVNLHHHPVIFFSTELDRIDIQKQLAESWKGGMPFHPSGDDHSEDKKNLLRKAVSSITAAQQRGELSLIFLQQLTEDIISDAIEYHCDKLNGGQAAVVMIDQASRIKRSAKTNNYALATEDMLNFIESMAVRHDCPVMMYSQLNRDADERSRPTMSDFKHSGAFEEFAHAIILQHQMDLIPGSGGVYHSELIVAKNRHGPKKTIPCFFNGPGHTWMENEAEIRKERVQFNRR